VSTGAARVDTRRILIFCGLAFGIAWAVGLVVFLTGGMAHSPTLVPGTPFTLAVVLVAVGYMWAPALANILTRRLTGEGWRDTHLRPQLRLGWRWWAVGWIAPSVLTLAGAALFFVVFPDTFDPSLGSLRALLDRALHGRPLPFGVWVIALMQVVQAVLIGPVVNGLFTFGEEFGWRGYLQPKLMPLGGRKAMLLVGVIWGAWHWPVIAMGHNYGLQYAGAPWLGMLMMVWLTIVLGIFLGWLTLRGGSVWPAVIGHGAINAIAGIGMVAVRAADSAAGSLAGMNALAATPRSYNPLLGPTAAGLIGSCGFALVAAVLLLHPRALAAPAPSGETPPPSDETAPPSGETAPPSGETAPPSGETPPPAHY
jgi:uncharacterized protein